MTDLYILTNIHGYTLGVFTSPQKAIEHTYLTEIYQVYRGYKAAPDKIIWEDDFGLNWYGRDPVDFDLPAWNRKPARYEIHISHVDWMVPVEDEIRAYAKRFPPLNELMPIVGYGSKSSTEEL